jgi:glycosyltransferase involved in cell wall biosynthesis
MLATELARGGRHQVALCAVHDLPGDSPRPPGVPVHSLRIRRTSGLGRLANYVRKPLRLAALKKQLGVDVSLSTLWPADWINALAGREAKVAIVQINVRDNPQNTLMVRLAPLARWIYRKFDRVVISNAALREEVLEFFRVPQASVETIPNPIDTVLIDRHIATEPDARLAPLLARYRFLVAANRLHPTKNTAALVAILERLPRRGQVKLLIIGEGEDESHVIATAERRGLRVSRPFAPGFEESADIYLVPFQANMHNLVSRAHIFLLPSLAEGSPLALLEALYCGTPALASDCPNGGVSLIMNPDAAWSTGRRAELAAQGGYLMPVPRIEDDNAIDCWARVAASLLEMGEQARRALGSAGRQNAAGYEKSAIVRRWSELIASLAAGTMKDRSMTRP